MANQIKLILKQNITYAFEIKENDDYFVVENKNHAIPEHGWKIHLSPILDDAISTLETFVKYAVKNEITFKVVKTTEQYQELLSDKVSFSAFGKFITIYTLNRDNAITIAEDLFNIFKSSDGVFINGDKSYKESKLIHYRYGEFIPNAFPQDDRNKFYVPEFENDLVVSNNNYNTLLLNDRYKIEKIILNKPSTNVYLVSDNDNSLKIIKHAKYGTFDTSLTSAIKNKQKEVESWKQIKNKDYFSNFVDEFYLEKDYFTVWDYIQGLNLISFQIKCTPFYNKDVFINENLCSVNNYSTIFISLLDFHQNNLDLDMNDTIPRNFIYDLKENKVKCIDLDQLIFDEKVNNKENLKDFILNDLNINYFGKDIKKVKLGLLFLELLSFDKSLLQKEINQEIVEKYWEKLFVNFKLPINFLEVILDLLFEQKLSYQEQVEKINNLKYLNDSDLNWESYDSFISTLNNYQASKQIWWDKKLNYYLNINNWVMDLVDIDWSNDKTKLIFKDKKVNLRIKNNSFTISSNFLMITRIYVGFDSKELKGFSKDWIELFTKVLSDNNQEELFNLLKETYDKKVININGSLAIKTKDNYSPYIYDGIAGLAFIFYVHHLKFKNQKSKEILFEILDSFINAQSNKLTTEKGLFGVLSLLLNIGTKFNIEKYIIFIKEQLKLISILINENIDYKNIFNISDNDLSVLKSIIQY
ncbi:hypothetical protein GE118_00565 [Mycoplasma sp. NEAQ87857]|uniref:class III lanthionine synthetase LanKC N-terminal domain-containing protein n=1 Tax=Mycoplasma sp. NEAQ87857 TaxID=2683967 RepID=UPI0013188184|nr:hypothetical protein [Mycoplasma sp. NEAQ87857]QGZ97296.1 hypothetical protein GE118_00565 [Mycoplasma sp. NEAQ87857]